MTAQVRSMTGFARVRKTLDDAEISVTLKSVNHRGLDLHFHTSGELDQFENALRGAVKRKVSRGHLDLRIWVTSKKSADPAALNEPLWHAYVAAFHKAAEGHKLVNAELDLNAALRVPGMFALAEPELDSGLESALVSTLEDALDVLNQFRAREGAELAAVIREQNRRVTAAAVEMEQIRGRALPAFQNRLNERLTELLGNASIDPQRLAHEAALLADRSDIGEELARLSIHSRQIDQILDGGGEVGKRLDFLLQEMNRETNTILSKTNGIGEAGLTITDRALATKSDVEKIREQALNLE
ncbi:MAG: YicC family protein [Acidobacteriota bacterium]|nr:YicC family protein [Acidobacteriota bacterium]